MVGAVLVRAGRVVATGFHPFAGGDHAEIVALKRAGAKAEAPLSISPWNRAAIRGARRRAPGR